MWFEGAGSEPVAIPNPFFEDHLGLFVDVHRTRYFSREQVEGTLQRIDWELFVDLYKSEGKAEDPFYDMLESQAVKQYNLDSVMRYAITLDHLYEQDKGQRVLELGSPPWGLSGVLRRYVFDHIELSRYGRRELYSYKEEVAIPFLGNDKKMCFDQTLFNIERDVFPYEDNTFDLVVCCEAIEHLAMDPMNVFVEVNRILRDGGRLFVSTPNLACVQNAIKVFNGIAPGISPAYRGDLGVEDDLVKIYARHNRELTTDEIEVMYRSGGFKVDYMGTANVYEYPRLPLSNLQVRTLHHLCVKNPTGVKDTIFACGTKEGSPDPERRYPSAFNLYL